MHSDFYSINTVAAKLGLSVHQLRRWELMFSLEIKRGRGQQRQYKNEDLTVLERIKELVEQGWPTSQIRPQLEAEGLLTPKLIGLPQTAHVGDDVMMETLIGLRSFTERRFIDLSKQIDELRQLIITITAKQELKGEDFLSGSFMDAIDKFENIESQILPTQEIELDFSQPEEISLGPKLNIVTSQSKINETNNVQNPEPAKLQSTEPPIVTSSEIVTETDVQFQTQSTEESSTIGFFANEIATDDVIEESGLILDFTDPPESEINATSIPNQDPPIISNKMIFGEITDQNYLTILGKALDTIAWSDEEADEFSQKHFGIEHWDELGRSDAERFVDYLCDLIAQK